MIERIELHDFKAHADTRMDLRPFTVLVGPNGAGKSSVLDALDLVGRMAKSGKVHVFTGRSSEEHLRRFGTDGFSIRVRPAGRPSIAVEVRWSPTEGAWDHKVLTDGGTAGRLVPKEIEREFASTLRLRLEPRKLADPSYFSPSEAPRLQPDGTGLASAIADLKLRDDERFEQLTDALQRVVPAVRRIKVQRASVRLGQADVTGEELMFDFVGARDVPAHSASEGTLVALGILTLVHATPRPNLILLDDIELGLHAGAQRKLVETLLEIARHEAPLQFVVTTHSPFIVDAVQPEDVQVMALREDGTVATRPLTAHPDSARLLKVLTAAELLTAEGEDWVTAATPDHG
jgi:predicted ATPase